jgi:hypothetical protein
MNRQSANRLSPSQRPRLEGGSRNRPHGPRRPTGHGPTYKCGDVVPQTGIYEVVHARAHRPPHEVVLHREDAFPDCEVCATEVRFRVIRTAPYIFDDEDFGPGA